MDYSNNQSTYCNKMELSQYITQGVLCVSPIFCIRSSIYFFLCLIPQNRHIRAGHSSWHFFPLASVLTVFVQDFSQYHILLHYKFYYMKSHQQQRRLSNKDLLKQSKISLSLSHLHSYIFFGLFHLLRSTSSDYHDIEPVGEQLITSKSQISHTTTLLLLIIIMGKSGIRKERSEPNRVSI